MTDCQHLESELWAWLENPAAHPSHLQFERHLTRCAPCQASVDGLRQLRQALKGLAEAPDPSFTQNLAVALADPHRQSRFAADPFLEDGPEQNPAGLVVDRRQRAFWVRPLSLVAAGAVAAVCIGLLGRWGTQETPPLSQGQSPVLDNARTQLADGTDPSLTDSAKTEGKEGILAERQWQEDSSRAQSGQPDSRERLTPVTTRP